MMDDDVGLRLDVLIVHPHRPPKTRGESPGNRVENDILVVTP